MGERVYVDSLDGLGLGVFRRLDCLVVLDDATNLARRLSLEDDEVGLQDARRLGRQSPLAEDPSETPSGRERHGRSSRKVAVEQRPDSPHVVPDTFAVFVMGFRGLRIGELAALRSNDLDLMRGTLRVDESLSEVGGRVVIGAPKTHESRRTVTLPAFLRDMLTEHLASFSDPRDPDAFVFLGPGGGILRPGNYRRRIFDPAVRAAGLSWRPTPHNLRDTAATLAITAGADVMEVARMLGHTDPAITLRRYAAVLESRRSKTDERLDSVFHEAAGSVSQPGGVVAIGEGRGR